MPHFFKVKLNILLAVVALFLGYVTCKNLKKTAETPATTQAAPPPVPQPRTHGVESSHVFDKVQPDSAAPIQVTKAPDYVNVPIDALPPASASHKAYLCNNDKYWHFNMAFRPTDDKVHVHYQDRYAKFFEDQTFLVIFQGKVIDKGRWNWDRDKNEIYLSCTNSYYNNTWFVKDKGNVMIWVGNTGLNTTGTQVRVVETGKPKDYTPN